MTGSYDPSSDLLYWGTGNPNPDYYGADRNGDNLYTSSIARDRRGHRHAALALPIHAARHARLGLEPRARARDAAAIGGERRRVVMVANRNGFFYVLDRVTGELLLGKPFTATTWAREIGADGRPIVLERRRQRRLPARSRGAARTSCRRRTTRGSGLFFVSARETCATFHGEPPQYRARAKHGRRRRLGRPRQGFRRAARDRRRRPAS